MTTTPYVGPDQLHRLVKLALDTGEAASLDEAQRLFGSYRLGIVAGSNVAHSATLQAVLLTAVNTGRRSFLGGVCVEGTLDVPLLVPWGRCRTLGEAIVDLQGLNKTPAPGIPRILIGDASLPSGEVEFAVRATFDGWCGGIVPLNHSSPLPESQECVPAGVLAGALGVSEAFQFVRGSNDGGGTAGRWAVIMATRNGQQLARCRRVGTAFGEAAIESLADRARAPWPSVPLDTGPPALRVARRREPRSAGL